MVRKRTTRKPGHDLVAVGHVGYDIPRTPRGRRRVVGGAAYFAAKGASLFSNRVAVVTRVGRDFDLGFLRRLGIDLTGVKVINRGKSFEWRSKYDKNFNVVSSRGALNVGARLDPKDIPASFLNAKHVHIASMPPKLQRRIIRYLRGKGCKAKISIDTVEQYIVESPQEVKEVMLQADIVFLNEREFARLKQLDKLEKQTVIKKRGAAGAELHYGGRITKARAPKVKAVVDTTGAGDLLAGVFLTLVAKGKKPADALREAVKVASKSVNEFGVEHL